MPGLDPGIHVLLGWYGGTRMAESSPAMTSGALGNGSSNYPARRCRAVERCARFVGRRGAERRARDLAAVRRPEVLPCTLCFSASIRLTTLLGFSSGSAALIGLPAALRFTSFFNAVSYSSLNFDGSKWAALVSRIWTASSIMSFEILGLLMPSK